MNHNNSNPHITILLDLLSAAWHRLLFAWNAVLNFLTTLLDGYYHANHRRDITGRVIVFDDVLAEDDSSYFNSRSNHHTNKISVKVVRKLAEGGFSYVYEVTLLQDVKSRFAMKRVLCSDDDTIKRCQHEIGIHKSFQGHPNLLSIVASKFEKLNSSSPNVTVCYMLFPLMESNLRDELNNRLLLNDIDDNRNIIRNIYNCRPFSNQQVLEIFADIVDAVKELHNNGLAHRDIKIENILLTKHFNAKIVPVLMDFGSVAPAIVPLRSRKSLMTLVDEASENSTMSYRAPELFEGHIRYGINEKDLDARVDVWSLGCVLFAMMYGYSPFECEIHGNNIKIVECSYLRVLGSIPKPRSDSELSDVYSKEIYDLVVWLLNQDRLARPTIEELATKVNTLLLSIGVSRQKHSSHSTAMGKPHNDLEEGNFFE